MNFLGSKDLTPSKPKRVKCISYLVEQFYILILIVFDILILLNLFYLMSAFQFFYLMSNLKFKHKIKIVYSIQFSICKQMK